MNHPNTHVQVAAGQDLYAAMADKLKAFFEHRAPCVIKEMNLNPGEYYKRMARPSDQHPNESPGSCPESNQLESTTAVSRGQLISLIRRLQDICQNVHPSHETFDCYGHEIRNLLILACTEVEGQWKAILEANGYIKERYTTNDYVLLNRAMRLNEYGISISHYPWLKEFSPFSAWGTTGKPTQELSWYDAYNSVKHDREKNFKNAKLVYAIEAVCACAIMLFAQFGFSTAANWRHEMFFFAPLMSPKWLPSEVYTFPYEGFANGYIALDYPF